MNNISVASETPDARPLLICDDVSNLRISDLASDPSVTAEYLIYFDNVRDAVIRGMVPPIGTRTWVKVTGKNSSDIILTPGDLRNVETPFQTEDSVSPEAVRLE